MPITVKTESGSVYELDPQELKLRRVPSDKEAQLRKDEEWIQMLMWPEIEVGYSMHIALAPLAEGYEVTMRHTTPVSEIVGDD